MRKMVNKGMLHHTISKQGRFCPDLGLKRPFSLNINRTASAMTSSEGGSANETWVENIPLNDIEYF